VNGGSLAEVPGYRLRNGPVPLGYDLIRI
jgi:hypothetical protein